MSTDFILERFQRKFVDKEYLYSAPLRQIGENEFEYSWFVNVKTEHRTIGVQLSKNEHIDLTCVQVALMTALDLQVPGVTTDEQLGIITFDDEELVKEHLGRLVCLRLEAEIDGESYFGVLIYEIAEYKRSDL